MDDGHIDSAWSEVAVINLDTSWQHDSITFGWCDSEAQKLDCVKSALTASAYRRVTLALDGTHHDRPATFTCGCCGEGFRSTIAQQKPFDQDAGYGICTGCLPLYAQAS